MKILIVEDNILLGKSIKRAFEETGSTVDLAIDGAEALYFTNNSEYHVIIVDWMLPRLSGIELVNKWRGDNKNTPIIMITAKEAVRDRIEGLTHGADDYLVKPFDMAELLARVQALHRRSISHGSNIIVAGPLVLNLTSHTISLNNQTLELTSKEYDLLAALANKAGKMVNRSALIGLLYALDTEPDSNSLDVLLTRVRKKLAGSDITIETIRGKGFILRVA